jgi:Gamma tubulin complex component C-terminal
MYFQSTNASSPSLYVFCEVGAFSSVFYSNPSLILSPVQNALAALFRMSRSSQLFPTLTSANNLLLRFRFSAQSFVSVIASHVTDVAVRGNVDPFLTRLTPGTFTDLFELANAYSDVMDDVLSACLLRSSQRTAGDALRGCMELALDLCVLAGDRKRGRVEEHAAMSLLETLHASFVGKMDTLVSEISAPAPLSVVRTGNLWFLQVKALRELVEKDSTSSHISSEYVHLAAGGSKGPMVTGGVGSLHHLLVRLDLGLDQRTSSILSSSTRRL